MIDFGVTPATHRQRGGAPQRAQRRGLDWLGYLGARGHGDCQGRRDQGLVRNRPWDREYLIFRRSTLTIEQHARELLDLLADEDPHDDPAERRLLLVDLLALIEERHEHWSE